uniref:Uncharacterized protein n=1 Tax=Takifugu rubripes TaxID=31033 RepID=A0A3B5KFN7_TAKRU
MTAGVVSAPFIIANSSLHTHGSRRDIDTDTPVFIQSDTPGVLIFYTLDGSKPDMVQCGSAARVRKYSKPIRLPAGRVTVRAIAVTSDGRESSIVTKMFMVQNRDSNKKEKDVLLTNEQVTKPPPQSSCCFQNSILSLSLPLSRCAHCLSARPSDQFSRFCPNCGAEVSEQRLSPTVVEEVNTKCSIFSDFRHTNNLCWCRTECCSKYLKRKNYNLNEKKSVSCYVTWQATPLSECTWNMATPTAEKSTQTVGLYYPSATQMQRERERALLLSRQSVADRHPPMTSISPGKGYWQRQLDHVCAHLRSYTQNNTPFKALLGDPCMGELVSAVVQEDHQHLTLTMSFALAGQGKKQVRSDPLPAGTRSSTHKQMQSPQLQVKDAQLMKELGPGRGQCSIVQQLLDQGADPTCCHSNDRHALAVAVLNGHHQVLPVLVQQGANIDQQSGPMKNSALHEAAALGPEGLQCAQVLLSCGAKVRRKNASGQTAFDLAVNSGCNNMVALLAAQIGLSLLDRLAKQK